MKKQKNLGHPLSEQEMKNIKMRRLLVFMFCALLLTSYINAQSKYSVVGSVYGGTEALFAANVSLSNSQDGSEIYGTSTNDMGKFSITLPKGLYKMEISYVGYVKYTTNVEVKGNVNLPPITLSEDSKLMNEIVVTARTVTYNTDGYIAEISKNPLYRNMDLAAVMKMTPGTYTTHNSVQLFGQNVSKIYLNGRELKLYGEQLINYLETIEAKNVKDMEVITASGVEEDAVNKGKSIIKISTINPESGGMANVGINSMNGEDKNLHSLNANVNWRMNKKWGLYFNGNGTFGNNELGNRTETHFYDTGVRRINESTIKNKLKGNIRTVLGISYDLDTNNLFSVEGTFHRNETSNPSYSNIRNQSGSNFTDIANGNVDATREYKQYNLSFIYTHKFNKNAQLDFKADRMETHTDDNSLQRYEYIGSDHTGYDHWNKEKNLIHTARLDFTQKFKKLNGKLTAGAKATWFTNKNNTDYSTYLNSEQNNTTSYTDLYDYKENVYALYAKYALTYKKLSMDFGVRMEHTQVSPESSSNPERNYENDYTDFFPEVSLNYILNAKKGHNINLSYDRGLARPYMETLNPLIRRTSEYSYSMGNPLLEANYYDQYTMTAVFSNKYALNVFYRYSDDGTFALSENKDGILYTSYQNGLKRSDFSAFLAIPVKIAKWMNVRINMGYGYLKESYLNNERDNHYYSISYVANFTLPNNFRISQDLYYGSVIKSLYGEESKKPSCNIVISKTFPKNGLNVGLSFMDIFNNLGSKRTDSFRDNFYQVTKGTNSNFGIALRVGYNFRWGKKSMVRRATSGNSEESGRVAAE